MMNCNQVCEAMTGIKGWEFVHSFAVGGFEYLGFVKSDTSKLLIVSGQKNTIFDCEDKSITEVDAVVDEKSFEVICDMFPDEYISIAGSYGGSITKETPQGDSVEITLHDPHVISGKELNLQQIDFIDARGNRTKIFDSYPSYVCGFSHDGRYFALADDSGIYLMKREEI